MKKQILFLVLSICSFSGIGQNSEPDEVTKKWKLDSTTIAREKFLLSTGKDINQIKNDQTTSDINTRNNEIKSNLTVFGDTKPTPLPGGVTISSGSVSTAETRLKVHKALDKAIEVFNIPVDKPIVIYSSEFFKSIPHFKVADAKLKNIKLEYTNLQSSIKTGAIPASLLAGVATAIGLVNAVANLGMLFKIETQLFVNNEAISESVIISKIIKKTSAKNIYYPSLYPPDLGSSSSNVITLLNEINELRHTIEGELKDKRKTDLTAFDQGLETLNNDLLREKSLLKIAKLQNRNIDTSAILVQIIVKERDIADLKSKNRLAVGINKALALKYDVIETEYKKINDALDSIIDKDNNLTALGLFIKIEKLVEILNTPGTRTLRVLATSKGTDQIKKSLWTTKLKNSASVEIEYQLFENNGKIISSDAYMFYEGFNGSNIQNGKN